MDNEARIARLKDTKYQELFGVKKTVFDKMMTILQEEFKALHASGGRPVKLSVLDKLIITLGYYREYSSIEHIAFDYNVSKSTICESIKWVETSLIRSGQFDLPSKNIPQDIEIETLVLDATECEIERPKKNSVNTILVRKKDTA